MNCFEFRQRYLSDPYSTEPEVLQHLAECEKCSAFSEEIKALDGGIKQALTVEVPEGLAAKILLNHSLQKPSRRPTRTFWFSMAASFLIVVSLIGFNSYQTNNNFDVEAALLAHANHQPHEFYDAEHSAVDNAALEKILNRFDVHAELDQVMYAAVCPLDGENAAHLVIKNGNEQYTVMLIPDKSPGQSFTVDSDTWHGVISPHPAGALAVLADNTHLKAKERLASVNQQLLASIVTDQGDD